MRVNKTVSAVLATTFAGAVALGGVTAGTAFAADEPRPQAGQQAPLPKVQQLQQQARVLGATSEALRPVAELIDAVLNAPEGRLSQAEADRHAKAVQEALAPLTQQAQGAQQAQQAQQADFREGANRNSPAAELTARAAHALEAQVDELLMAAEAGDQQGIAKEAERTVQAAVNLMAAASADGRLPAADMKGLPYPNVQQHPQQNVEHTTQAEQLPQVPANQLPPGNAEAELLPGDPELELLPE